METGKTLQDYAEYTSRVRTYAAEMSLDEAVERAITECIREEGIEDGVSQVAVNMLKLREFTDEQIKAATGLNQEQLDELRKNQHH